MIPTQGTRDPWVFFIVNLFSLAISDDFPEDKPYGKPIKYKPSSFHLST